MNKIEQAVIALDGDPANAKSGTRVPISQTVLSLYDGVYIWAHPTSAAGEGYLGYVVVCTYDQFMEARKRLENMPTGWPDWAKYLTHHENGMWGFTECHPDKYESANGKFVGKLLVVCNGHVFGGKRKVIEREPKIDWSKAPEGYDYWIEDKEGDIAPGFHKLKGDRYVSQDGSFWPVNCPYMREGVVSVQKRPTESKPIQPSDGVDIWPQYEVTAYDGDDAVYRFRSVLGHEDAGPAEWQPGVDLPPAGVECEYRLPNGWNPCRVIGYDGSACVVAVDGCSGYFSNATPGAFRPLKSHRDKVIEALCEIANKPEVSKHNFNIDVSVGQRALIEAIADSGLVKLPEGEE